MRLDLNPSERAATPSTAYREVDEQSERAVGARLEEARSADQSWRASLLLGLYRKLGKLRRFDRWVQYGGAGTGFALLAAALILILCSPRIADDREYGRLLMLLIGEAMAASASGLVLVGVVGWCQERIRRWIFQMGMEKEVETPASSGTSPTGTDHSLLSAPREMIRVDAALIVRAMIWLLILAGPLALLWAVLAVLKPAP